MMMNQDMLRESFKEKTKKKEIKKEKDIYKLLEI
jgi:hypothetical protein